MVVSAGSDLWAFSDALSEGVYGVDREGLCTFVNRAALSILGYQDADELIGQNMHGAIHHTRPDGTFYPVEACPLLHTLTSGRPVTLNEELLWRKDGSCFLAEYSSYPVSAGGAVTGSVIVFKDCKAETADAREADLVDIAANWGTDERRRASETLQDSEARFRTLADSIPQLTWMTGPDGSIEWYNRRWYEYTGTSLDQMRGWGWRSVHHPDHLDRVVARITDAFATGTPWEDTFPLRGRDGSYRWFLSRATPIRGQPSEHHPEGRIVGWFGTNTDVTELRETEERLSAARLAAEEANKAKSDFIANMSHELRTPLSAIIGYSEMMREEMAEGAEPAELASDMQKVEGNARHLLGLINDVLDLSKIESGRMDVYPEAFDVARIVHDVAGTVGALVVKKGNTLAFSLGDDLGSMRSDLTKIKQVLLNLLSNAAKFTDGGTITLSATRITDAGRDDWLSFRVADTGIGMSPAQLARLFQRFAQADASTTRKFGGTGLGLAISKAFAQMLGGDLAVESEPGRGTAFSLIVPATCPDAPSASAPTPSGAVSPAGPAAQARTRGLVLVIDDDPSQRDLLSRFLAREGFGSCEAADGPRGLELARALRPKVILLDVVMPTMDGWSVLAQIKSDPTLASIPVVMVTFAGDRTLAQSLGAAEYLLKPVDWGRFKQVMDRFLDDSRTVLVVDDDADMRRRMRHALERDGWTVAEAPNGADALASVASQPPSVVLLDLLMPIMDGFTFLSRLRQVPGCRDTPVIVLTASDLTADDRARLRSAEQILQKGGTDLSELARELHGLVAATT